MESDETALLVFMTAIALVAAVAAVALIFVGISRQC